MVARAEALSKPLVIPALFLEAGFSNNTEYYTNEYREGIEKPAGTAEWYRSAAKNELGVSPGAKLPAFLAAPSKAAESAIERSGPAIERLARLSPIRFEAAPAGAAMQVTAGTDLLVIPLEGTIDVDAEKARLAKAREASLKERDSLAKRLENPAFVEKAKPEAVDKARADHAHHAAEAERLEAALARLG